MSKRPKKRRDKRKRKPTKRGAPKVEWVGALVEGPMVIDDGNGPPRHPWMAMWVEVPSGMVVGVDLAEGDEEGLLGRTLAEALRRSGRRPARVRVASQAAAAEVRAVVGRGTMVRVAPTPEVDFVVAEMAQSLGLGPTTLFTDPTITRERLARFFRAARMLWTAAPWKVVGDMAVFEVNVPAMGIEGACVSVLGAAGQARGLGLFESLEHLAQFAHVGTTRPEPGDAIDLGGDELFLSFDADDELPEAIVAEAKEQGFDLGGPGSFPTLTRVCRDGAPEPPTAEEYDLMTGVAAAVASAFLQHGPSIGEGATLSATFELDGTPPVTLTGPHPAGDSLGAEGQAAPGERSGLHDFGHELVHEILACDPIQFEEDVRPALAERLQRAGASLAVPWLVYVWAPEGETLAQRYADLEELTPRERRYLEAQRASWLSVWEVAEVDPGRGLALVDLLTGIVLRVDERAASQSLRKRQAVLARLLEWEGERVIDGMHQRPLPPRAAAEVVARARKRLRRKRDVPVERLRNEAIAKFLLARWDEACEAQDRSAAVPPKLVNTEGHDLLLTIDRYRYEIRAHDWLLDRLARIELADIERNGATSAVVTFHMEGNPKIPSWDNTIIGRAELSHGTMRVEANSVERADALRDRVLEVADDIVRAAGRSHADPMSEPALAEMAARAPRQAAEPPPPEILAAIAEHKAQHYATWCDQPLPALGGDTPREHARTREGRAAVDALLKDMEYLEQSQPETAYDFGKLRAALGLEAP